MELSAQEDLNRRMLRARDEMDRRYAEPLDVPTARRAHPPLDVAVRAGVPDVFGETPHRYLQRRRVERAMALLRQTDRPVTEVAWDVGFASLGTFSRTFSRRGLLAQEFRAQSRAGARADVLRRRVDPAPRGGTSVGPSGRPRPGQTVSEKQPGVPAD